MKELYETNEEFRAYVNRFAAGRGIEVKEALRFCIVKEMGTYYKNKHK